MKKQDNFFQQCTLTSGFRKDPTFFFTPPVHVTHRIQCQTENKIVVFPFLQLYFVYYVVKSGNSK